VYPSAVTEERNRVNVMRVIAVEEHFTTHELIAAEGVRGGGPVDELLDLGQRRIAAMDEAGVDMMVISTRAPAVQNLSALEAVPLARAANDVLAAAVADHPSRYAAIATLPTPDPQAAADELRRCVEQLGFRGAVLHGHTSGRFLDDPAFTPIFEAAVELGVPLWLHPQPPPPAVFDAYFGGLEPRAAAILARAGHGWHAETALHALRMILTGVFDRFPTLQIVVGHMGEGLPFSLHRANVALRPAAGGLERSVAEYFLENFYVSTSGYFTMAPLQCALSVVGADRILFSIDYPFSPLADGTAFLRAAVLAPDDLAKIAHRNAERLLGL
jgi:predicted TIM-barrel fold metal-dependent hydrolase